MRAFFISYHLCSFANKMFRIDRSRSKGTRNDKMTGYRTEFHAKNSGGAVQGLVSREMISLDMYQKNIS